MLNPDAVHFGRQHIGAPPRPAMTADTLPSSQRVGGSVYATRRRVILQLRLRTDLALTLLTVAAVLTLGYAGISTFVATWLAYAPPEPITTTPAALGLDFRAVTVHSRGDGVPLRGWFIPGLLPAVSLYPDGNVRPLTRKEGSAGPTGSLLVSVEQAPLKLLYQQPGQQC